MQAQPTHRQLLDDGSIRLVSEHCTFSIIRGRASRAGCMLVTISGFDHGQFGDAPLDEIRAELQRFSPLELFVDARAATGATLAVSQEWTRFFSDHRSKLKGVSILVESKFVHLTVSIARHLSQTGNLIRIFSEADEFERRLNLG